MDQQQIKNVCVFNESKTYFYPKLIYFKIMQNVRIQMVNLFKEFRNELTVVAAYIFFSTYWLFLLSFKLICLYAILIFFCQNVGTRKILALISIVVRLEKKTLHYAVFLNVMAYVAYVKVDFPWPFCLVQKKHKTSWISKKN